MHALRLAAAARARRRRRLAERRSLPAPPTSCRCSQCYTDADGTGPSRSCLVMTVAALRWGAGLIAFSPPTSVFLFVVLRKPELVIISIMGAFCYLLSLLICSIIWYIIPPLRRADVLTVIVSVLAQTLARLLIVRLYARTEAMIKSSSHPTIRLPLNDVTSCIAAGSGFALMHLVMLFGSVLASYDSEPGVYYARSCGLTPFVLVMALVGLAFGLLDMVLMVLTFVYFRKRLWRRIGVVIALHLCAGLMTIINHKKDGCNASLPLLCTVLVVSILFTTWDSWHLRPPEGVAD